jgi:hypothetical protein
MSVRVSLWMDGRGQINQLHGCSAVVFVSLRCFDCGTTRFGGDAASQVHYFLTIFLARILSVAPCCGDAV